MDDDRSARSSHDKAGRRLVVAGEVPPPHAIRWDRRQFLTVVGAGVLGSILASCGSSSGPSSPTATGSVDKFRSRPDLDPPEVSVTGPAGEPAAGYVFVTPGGPLILDDDGDPVWYRPVPHAATDLRVQRYRGAPVLTWWEGEIAHYGVGTKGEVVILDTSYREVQRVRAKRGLVADLHEFIISGDGVGYLTAYHEVTADLSAVGGPEHAKMLDAVIQGIDLSTGQLVFEWHSADHIDVSESYQKYSHSKSAPYDPVHVNSIDPTADGNLLVSARNTWTVYKVAPSTGDIVWRLGGKKNDFALGPGVHFAWQHDARGHPTNILTLFDDEADPPEAKQSRGLMLAVDETAMTADLVRAYDHPAKKLLAGSQGSVQVLPNGDVFVGWGAKPYYTEFRASGATVLDGHILKSQSYRAFRFPWAATPTEPPAMAVETKGTDHFAVYASWNGATEVKSWSVLGGRTRDALAEVGAADRTGFETVIDVHAPASTRFLAVQAVDRTGAPLRTSAVVPAR